MSCPVVFIVASMLHWMFLGFKPWSLVGLPDSQSEGLVTPASKANTNSPHGPKRAIRPESEIGKQVGHKLEWR
ncbi:hypothetical protein QBC47DRAFT_388779 [Echria macrotheca]|uniref:Uncharacterized protein n=1 Tax=Echria macrotheca TaxID=438768 RepID=A0AAJ0B6E7_9PEZI|nr:hypothetical protein QBC47DRAFT_388779 [Echria macrotheca]